MNTSKLFLIHIFQLVMFQKSFDLLKIKTKNLKYNIDIY